VRDPDIACRGRISDDDCTALAAPGRAVPADGARPTPDDVQALIASFRSGLVDVTGPGTIVGEFAAVAVRAPFRRRGIASALSAYLARTAHSQAIPLVFLEAEPGEERTYRRTGFVHVTTKIWMSLR
jgi:GNAT superfamily N-acetyltransferase